MKKLCPRCELNNLEEAKFCHNCGYQFDKSNDKLNILKDGKLFIILIATILIVGAILITTTIHNTNDELPINDTPQETLPAVKAVITKVQLYDYTDEDDPYYEYRTFAIFQVNEQIDSDNNILVLTSYMDKDNNTLRTVTQTLHAASVYTFDGESEFAEYATDDKVDLYKVHVEIVNNTQILSSTDYIVDESELE